MLFTLFIGPWQMILIVLALGIIPTIIALIDILRNEFSGNNKLIWFLVVLFLNIIGAFLYLLIGRQHKLPKNKISS